MADSRRTKSRAKDEKPAEETAPAAAEETTAVAEAAEETPVSDKTPGAESEGEFDHSPPASVAGAVQNPGAAGLTPKARSRATAPGSAPLDPATSVEEGEDEPPKVADAGVAFAARANELFDADTGQAPSPDELFQPLNDHTSAQVCQKRLLERTYLDIHNHAITRVVMPAGTVISQAQAELIKARIGRQSSK